MAVLIAAGLPVLALGGLVWLADRRAWRRRAMVERQVGLTDAVRRELGAAAASVVERDWRGGWTVSLSAPLEREALVGALVRIVHRFFAERGGGATPLRLVLTRQEAVWRPAETDARVRRLAA